MVWRACLPAHTRRASLPRSKPSSHGCRAGLFFGTIGAEPDRARLRIAVLAVGPIGVHLAEVGIRLQVMLVRQGTQRFHGYLRSAVIAAAGLDDGLEKQRARDRCGMTQLIGATGRLINEPARSLEFAQMPFRQRQEV